MDEAKFWPICEFEFYLFYNGRRNVDALVLRIAGELELSAITGAKFYNGLNVVL